MWATVRHDNCVFFARERLRHCCRVLGLFVDFPWRDFTRRRYCRSNAFGDRQLPAFPLNGCWGLSFKHILADYKHSFCFMSLLSLRGTKESVWKRRNLVICSGTGWVLVVDVWAPLMDWLPLNSSTSSKQTLTMVTRDSSPDKSIDMQIASCRWYCGKALPAVLLQWKESNSVGYLNRRCAPRGFKRVQSEIIQNQEYPLLSLVLLGCTY